MMATRIRAATAALGIVLFAPAALAQALAPRDASLGSLGDRDRLLVVFERMPAAQLQAFFLHCSRESSRRLFGFDEAVPCAMAWDAMLKRRFEGDVDALLAWWRMHRDDPDEAAVSE